MRRDKIIKITENYCRKNKLDYVKNYILGKPNILEILCGDKFKDGFSVECNSTDHYKTILVQGPICPSKEVKLEIAGRIAYEIGEEYELEISMYTEELIPPNAGLLEKFAVWAGIKKKYIGEIEVLSYSALADSAAELSNAIEAVQLCRTKHPKRYMLLEMLKKMPEWKDYVENGYRYN